MPRRVHQWGRIRNGAGTENERLACPGNGQTRPRCHSKIWFKSKTKTSASRGKGKTETNDGSHLLGPHWTSWLVSMATIISLSLFHVYHSRRGHPTRPSFFSLSPGPLLLLFSMLASSRTPADRPFREAFNL